jgi:hypothetical protein
MESIRRVRWEDSDHHHEMAMIELIETCDQEAEDITG